MAIEDLHRSVNLTSLLAAALHELLQGGPRAKDQVEVALAVHQALTRWIEHYGEIWGGGPLD